jgi:hypothetical protein
VDSHILRVVTDLCITFISQGVKGRSKNISNFDGEAYGERPRKRWNDDIKMDLRLGDERVASNGEPRY